MKKFNEAVPIYLQVREEIETAIITGAIKENEMIPSIRKIAAQYRLNPQTVSNALSDLLADGVLYKKRGIGMFVSETAPQQLIAKQFDRVREKDLKNVIIKCRNLGMPKAEIFEIIEQIFMENHASFGRE